MKYKLFDKYKDLYLKDLTVIEGPQRIYYFIPPEYVINPIITNSITITKTAERISDNYDNWIYCRYFSRFLKESTGYDTQEWYDMIELHLSDPSERPKCSVCNNELPWSGRLSWGYRMDSTGYNPIHRFCSYECKEKAGSVGWKLIWEMDYEGMYNTVTNNGFINNQDEKGNNAYLDLRYILSESWNENDEASLYIVKSLDKFKVGFSRLEYPYERIRVAKMNLLNYPDSLFYVFRGNWKYVAYLEYNLKLGLFKYRIQELGFETFDLSHYNNVIKSLLSNKKLKLIRSNQSSYL